MKLGLLQFSGGSGEDKKVNVSLESIRHVESLGFDSVWVAEAYATDAISCSTWILAQTEKIRVGTAIMQMPARTPALAAMTAMTLSELSNNRFIVGLGASGPQVVEGWHGVPYGKPITRTREYIKIMRAIMEREDYLNFQGDMYTVPATGEGTTGLGKPLKSMLYANAEIPIYTASITPAGLRCAAEVADGTIPVWMDPEKYHIFSKDLEAGFAKANGNKSLKDFEIATLVNVSLNNDLEAAFAFLRPRMATYIGGMGARNKNFYNDYACKMGYADVAKKIQDLYLDGKVAEAVSAVPDSLIDEVALVGSKDRIKDRLQRWKEAGKRGEVNSMLLAVNDNDALAVVAEEIL